MCLHVVHPLNVHDPKPPSSAKDSPCLPLFSEHTQVLLLVILLQLTIHVERIERGKTVIST
jgi:hypothetical protein